MVAFTDVEDVFGGKARTCDTCGETISNVISTDNPLHPVGRLSNDEAVGRLSNDEVLQYKSELQHQSDSSFAHVMDVDRRSEHLKRLQDSLNPIHKMHDEVKSIEDFRANDELAEWLIVRYRNKVDALAREKDELIEQRDKLEDAVQLARSVTNRLNERVIKVENLLIEETKKLTESQKNLSRVSSHSNKLESVSRDQQNSIQALKDSLSGMTEQLKELEAYKQMWLKYSAANNMTSEGVALTAGTRKIPGLTPKTKKDKMIDPPNPEGKIIKVEPTAEQVKTFKEIMVDSGLIKLDDDKETISEVMKQLKAQAHSTEDDDE